jgi:hypothetical protein
MKWSPALRDGENISLTFLLPLKFMLDKKTMRMVIYPSQFLFYDDE